MERIKTLQCSDCIFSITEELDRLYCAMLKEDITDRENICDKFKEF